MPRLDFALLANAAAGPPDGLVYVLGGGIDTVTSSQLPVPLIATLVLRVLRNRTEANVPVTCRLEIQDQDGNPPMLVGPAGNQVALQPIEITIPAAPVPQGLPAHWEIATNAILPIVGLPLPREGIYSIEVLLNNQHVRSVPLRVVLTQ